MEILTIVLSGLLSLVSGGGTILDLLAASQIRSQIISVEQQTVRVDNRPSYQITRGKLHQIRIASRGIMVQPGLRIAAVDLATDPIALRLSNLNFDSVDGLRNSLEKPASGAIKLVLTQSDLNQALQSPEVLAQLQKTLNRLLTSTAGSTRISYQLSNLHLELQPANRLQVRFKLSRPRPNIGIDKHGIVDSTSGTNTINNRSRELNITLKLAIEVINGKTLRLIEPQGTVNDRPISARLLNGFAEGISDRLDLNFLEADGILARILQLEIDEDRLELVSFIRLETESKLSSEQIKPFPRIGSLIHAGS
ncbi:MAG: DUF2993 domain-containing protein [Pleurocapsa sp.]